MPISFDDEQLLANADRIANKVVVITGAAKGIGKQTALLYAAHGARVVIGDLDGVNGEKTTAEINAGKLKGKATFIKCNVTVWDDQVALFEHAIKVFGSVDVVVVNAGVGEKGLEFGTVNLQDGKPVPFSLLTIDVNVKGALFTAHLAQHYLMLNKKDGDLKALVIIGSMASWMSLAFADMYTASKHAMLGLMRSMHIRLKVVGIRTASIHPWFADTEILETGIRLMIAGIPLTSVPRVAGAIFAASTDPREETDGCAWLLADNGNVVMVQKEEFKFGVYKVLDDRINAITRGINGLLYWTNLTKDLFNILVKPRLGYVAAIGLAGAAWSRRDELQAIASSIVKP